MRLPVVQNTESPQICKPCGGKCCKAVPGVYHPAQFPTAAGITSALASKKVVVDSWAEHLTVLYGVFNSPKGNILYLRPRIKARPARVDVRGKGTCVHFRPTKGCTLDHDIRPLGCKLLVPDPEGFCAADDTLIVRTIRAWEKHRKVMATALGAELTKSLVSP